MSQGQILKTESDFYDAILFQIIVSITLDGEHMDSGRIIKQTDNCIHTIDGVYFKRACEVRIVTVLH